jgi:acyl-coenzyme A thioesterase PaaI-like protein
MTQTIKPNRLTRYINKIKQLPSSLHSWLITKLFCSQVKFANTAGVKILQADPEQVVMTLKNRKKVQNHIGGVHAVAAALLAESCSGLMLGLHVPDSRLPLLKSMTIHYVRRMQGNLKAVASLSAEQIAQVQQTEKGDLVVPVTITDESGEQPVICEMNWAWISKKR